jgi:hypothetical protein
VCHVSEPPIVTQFKRGNCNRGNLMLEGIIPRQSSR